MPAYIEHIQQLLDLCIYEWIMSRTLVNAIMNDASMATIYNTGIHSGQHSATFIITSLLTYLIHLPSRPLDLRVKRQDSRIVALSTIEYPDNPKHGV